MRDFAFKLLTFSLLLTVILSCAPMVAYIELEKKVESENEIDLHNRNVAVLVESSESVQDSLVLSHLCDGITQGIEQYYSYSELSIPVYSFSQNELDTESMSEMIAYSSFASSDLLIVVEDCHLQDFSVEPMKEKVYQDGAYYVQKQVRLPYRVHYTIFDADQAKSVYQQVYADTLLWQIASPKEITDLAAISRANKNLTPALEEASSNWISSLLPQWISDARVFYVYDSPEWIQAYEFSHAFMWKEAVDIWVKLADSRNDMKAAAAAFNIAVAMELTGEYELALKWVAYSKARSDMKTQEALEAVIVKDQKEAKSK